MTNQLRNPDFIKIKQRINNAAKLTTLDSLRQLVDRYSKNNADGKDLFTYLHLKEKEINPFYEDEIETMIHAKTCGAH